MNMQVLYLAYFNGKPRNEAGETSIYFRWGRSSYVKGGSFNYTRTTLKVVD